MPRRVVHPRLDVMPTEVMVVHGITGLAACHTNVHVILSAVLCSFQGSAGTLCNAEEASSSRASRSSLCTRLPRNDIAVDHLIYPWRIRK